MELKKLYFIWNYLTDECTDYTEFGESLYKIVNDNPKEYENCTVSFMVL